jgi:hypothetical protein
VVEGVDERRAVLAVHSWEAAKASSKVSPVRTTSAPYARVASTFGSGAPAGMKTRAGTPASGRTAPPPARGCPRRRRRRRRPARLGEVDDAVVGAADLERAGPLQVLALEEVRTPAASETARDVSTGVRWATPSSRVAAARMSSRVTRLGGPARGLVAGPVRERRVGDGTMEG